MRVIITLFLLCGPLLAGYADSCTAVYVGTASTNCTLSSAVVSGDAVIVAVSTIGGAFVSSITDGIGNTYSNLQTYTYGTSWRLTVYKSYNVASGASDVVTVTLGGADTGTIAVLRYTSVNSSPLDGGPTANGNFLAGGGTADPGSFSTTNANDIIIGIVYCYAGVGSPASGYTQRTYNSGTAGGIYTEDQTVSSTGTYDPTFTLSGASQFAAVGFSLKVSGGAKVCVSTLSMLGTGNPCH
jgi:hypothetical protein